MAEWLQYASRPEFTFRDPEVGFGNNGGSPFFIYTYNDHKCKSRLEEAKKHSANLIKVKSNVGSY